MQTKKLSKKRLEALTNTLQLHESVEFEHNGMYYHIYTSIAEDGYVVDVYESDARDEDGLFPIENIIDGGHCSGCARDAIEFI